MAIALLSSKPDQKRSSITSIGPEHSKAMISSKKLFRDRSYNLARHRKRWPALDE
jgi:hypothetical protein